MTNPRESETMTTQSEPDIERDRAIVNEIVMMIDTPLLRDLSAAARLEFVRLCIDPDPRMYPTSMMDLWRGLSDGERGLLIVAHHLSEIIRVRGHFDLHRQLIVGSMISLWAGEWVTEGRA